MELVENFDIKKIETIVKDDLNIPISLIFGYWMAGAFLMSIKSLKK